MTRLLFTGGGGAGQEALFRICNEYGYEAHFADADPDAIDPAIPKERRHAIPMAGEADFSATLIDLCRHLAIDLLVPGVDEELPRMAEFDALAPGLAVMVPEPAYVRCMLDKLAMARALAAAGVPVPLTGTLAEPPPGLAYPCIAKPRSGRGSRGVHVLTKPGQGAAYAGLYGIAPDQVLVQQLGQGQEYTVAMVADSAGRLCDVVPVRVGLKRGITLRAETHAEPRVIAACRRIHEAMPARGCYNVQLMLTAVGQVLPFEINPRVSTTLCLVFAAGLDPFAAFLGAGAEAPPIAWGKALRRHWKNVFTDGDGEIR